MILDAHAMTTWQACRRRYLLESDYRVIRWRPKALYDALLRRAIFSLSNGGDAATCASEASAAFLQSAANPGLDLPSGANPYVIAKSWCGMFDTFLRALAMSPLLVLRDLAPVRLSSTLTWQPRAWVDESNQLHRWITVDAWDADQLSRTMHSWPVVGDIAATLAPMMLHVVEIGRATKDGRSCPWSRAWKHPMPGIKYHFRKPLGGELSSGWLPYYYNDIRDDPDEWAERLVAEGEWQRATHHLLIECPTTAQSSEVMRQVMIESLDIHKITSESRPWHTIPMSRGACDGFVPCPFQHACYSEQVVDPATIGLYQRREQVTLRSKE